MKTPEEIIKEKYPFYDENYTNKDVELNGKQVTELMIRYADQFKQVKVEPEVIVNFADIKEIYEKHDIPIDADAEGLPPLYYSNQLLREFIGDLNAYFEKCI